MQCGHSALVPSIWLAPTATVCSWRNIWSLPWWLQLLVSSHVHVPGAEGILLSAPSGGSFQVPSWDFPPQPLGINPLIPRVRFTPQPLEKLVHMAQLPVFHSLLWVYSKPRNPLLSNPGSLRNSRDWSSSTLLSLPPSLTPGSVVLWSLLGYLGPCVCLLSSHSSTLTHWGSRPENTHMSHLFLLFSPRHKGPTSKE